MSRTRLQRQLLDIAYPLYTESLKRFLEHHADPPGRTSDIAETLDDALLTRLDEDLGGPGEDLFDSAEHDADHNLTSKGREQIRAYIIEASSYAATLTEMSDDEFRATYDESKIRALNEQNSTAAREGSSYDKWAFFNDPQAAANFSAWHARPAWSVQETAALLLGKEPGIVNLKALQSQHGNPSSPFIHEFKMLVDILNRALILRELSDPINPMKAIKWAGGAPDRCARRAEECLRTEQRLE